MMWTADSMETLEGRRRRGSQRMRWLDDFTDAITNPWGHIESDRAE